MNPPTTTRLIQYISDTDDCWHLERVSKPLATTLINAGIAFAATVEESEDDGHDVPAV